MILNIFTDLFNNFSSNISSDLYNALPLNFIFFVIILIFGLSIYLVFSFLILPLFKRSPVKLYKKYLSLRYEMKRIDDAYSAKKIIFEEYVSMQFLNAQEYYHIVKLLADNPEFKSKLKGYTLKDNFDRSSTKSSYSSPAVKLTSQDIERKQINKLCTVLKPKALIYSKEDIYAILLSEGFSNNLIESVIKELINQNVVFSKVASSTAGKKDLSLFLDNLFESKIDKSKTVNKENDISSVMNNTSAEHHGLFENDFKRKELNFDKVEDVDYTFKSDVSLENKKFNFFKRIFSIFKKKEASVPKPTITEIDDILKNIESEIKGKEF